MNESNRRVISWEGHPPGNVPDIMTARHTDVRKRKTERERRRENDVGPEYECFRWQSLITVEGSKIARVDYVLITRRIGQNAE